MKELFLPEERLQALMDAIEAKYETMLFTDEGIIPYRSLGEAERRQVALRGTRSPFPAKSFFLPVRESLAEYGPGVDLEEGSKRESRSKPFALVNLRSCDLQAIGVLDHVFLEGDFVDPFYKARRDSVLVVSVDCLNATEYCFCNMVGYEPFVKNDLGLNLSPVSGGYVVRSESAKGAEVLKDFYGSDAVVRETQHQEMQQNQAAILAQLQDNGEKFACSRSYYEILKASIPEDKWNDLFSTCVECASCTNICPTCYCFYMFDQKKSPEAKEAYEKLRSWDSCLLADYSRMAGVGGVKPNPRPRIRTRYENRFRHKYEYFYETYKQYGCTGCGRCSEACMGATDPREVMRVLSQ